MAKDKHHTTTFELPPRYKGGKAPRAAIGHDYDAFCRLYAKYYKAREAARAENRPFSPRFKDDTEELIFSSALRKLRENGIVVTGLHDNRPIFQFRQKSAVDLELEKRPLPSPEEARAAFHQHMKGIG